jgi:hypothetical protein
MRARIRDWHERRRARPFFWTWQSRPPVNLTTRYLSEGDTAAEKLETRFSVLPKTTTSIKVPRRSGNGLGHPPGGNRRISFGEVRMAKCLPGESLRSSPGYMPRPLRGRVSRLPTRPSPAGGPQNIGKLFGTPHNFYKRRSCAILTSSALIHAASILPVMLSEAKYLSISLGFRRREILYLVQDDRSNPPPWFREGVGEGRLSTIYRRPQWSTYAESLLSAQRPPRRRSHIQMIPLT